MVVERLLSSWEKPIFTGYVSFRVHIPVDVNQQKMHEKISILLSSASVEKSHISGICFNRTLGKHGNWEVEKWQVALGKSEICFSVFMLSGETFLKAQWITLHHDHIHTTLWAKQVNRLQRIRGTTESIPKFGLSPFPTIVTTRNFTFFYKSSTFICH